MYYFYLTLNVASFSIQVRPSPSYPTVIQDDLYTTVAQADLCTTVAQADLYTTVVQADLYIITMYYLI